MDDEKLERLVQSAERVATAADAVKRLAVLAFWVAIIYIVGWVIGDLLESMMLWSLESAEVTEVIENP